jgi:hypothetical protein
MAQAGQDPPQSLSLSFPFFTPSVHVGAGGVPPSGAGQRTSPGQSKNSSSPINCAH